MKEFKVATYDQHLWFEDDHHLQLEGNDKTLAQLNVYPETTLLLRVSQWLFVYFSTKSQNE